MPVYPGALLRRFCASNLVRSPEVVGMRDGQGWNSSLFRALRTTHWWGWNIRLNLDLVPDNLHAAGLKSQSLGLDRTFLRRTSACQGHDAVLDRDLNGTAV